MDSRTGTTSPWANNPATPTAESMNRKPQSNLLFGGYTSNDSSVFVPPRDESQTTVQHAASQGQPQPTLLLGFHPGLSSSPLHHQSSNVGMRRSDASMCQTPKPVLNRDEDDFRQLHHHRQQLLKADIPHLEAGTTVVMRNAAGHAVGNAGSANAITAAAECSSLVVPSSSTADSATGVRRDVKQNNSLASTTDMVSSNSSSLSSSVDAFSLNVPQFANSESDGGINRSSNGIKCQQHVRDQQHIVGRSVVTDGNLFAIVGCPQHQSMHGATHRKIYHTDSSTASQPNEYHPVQASMTALRSNNKDPCGVAPFRRYERCVWPACWVSLRAPMSVWSSLRPLLEPFTGPIDSWILTGDVIQFLGFRTATMAKKCLLLSGTHLSGIELSFAAVPSNFFQHNRGLRVVDVYGPPPASDGDKSKTAPDSAFIEMHYGRRIRKGEIDFCHFSESVNQSFIASDKVPSFLGPTAMARGFLYLVLDFIFDFKRLMSPLL